jgi:hypothetical protein
MFELQPKRKRTTELESKAKRKRNNSQGMIIEGVNLPLRITGCQEGKTTQYGNQTLRYNFQHLESKEEFTSIILETNLFNSIANQIINAALPKEMDEYLPEDLVGCGVFAKIKINTKDGKTFFNVVEAKPLNKKYSEMLVEVLAEEALEQQEEGDDEEDNNSEIIEDESDLDMNDLDIGGMDIDDLDIDGLDIDEEDDNYEEEDED